MTKSSSLTQSKRSGGPQSDEGKKVSSRNAIKSGAYSKAVILPGEDESEYRELEAQFMRDFAPRDIAEGAMVRELTILTWKKIRLDQLEHRAVLQALNKPIASYELGSLFLMRPEAEWVIGSLEILTEQYFKDCLKKKSLAHELLGGAVTPPILESLKKKHPSLYEDIMDEASEYDVDDLSHEALCKDTIAGDDGRQTDLLHFIIQKQVEEYDDLIWAFEHIDRIQSKIVEVKDERLIDLMQRDKTSRAREDLSRSFFRTLSELRKHQHWRYQRDAVDVSPPVDEDD
jgi:hypothetical protein